MTSVCPQIRPDWDGDAVSALSETMALAISPVSVLLLAATMLAVRFKSQWGALIVAIAWSFYTAFLTMLDPGGTFANARAEGCVGSPTLFIALVAAICVGMILYTAPNPRRET